MLKWGLAVGLVLTGLTVPALIGTVSLVTSRSELNANDSINSSQGPSLTIFPTRWRRNLCWNLIGAVSSRVRILGQAARSIGVSASFWVSVCHPSTLRMVI